MSCSQQFCTFYLQSQFFGVPVQQVQEVLNYQEMTRVPLTPPTVRGLMNVVVRTDDGAISLLVDEIGDVLDVEQDSFEPPPATLQEELRAQIRGVYKLQGRLLLVLDTSRALEVGSGASEKGR